MYSFPQNILYIVTLDYHHFLRFIYEIHYFLSLLTSISCQTSPEGLRVTPDGTGPMIVVDWDAEPLPELPFPNNLATRPDPLSPTGRRLNISTVAMTNYESETRAKLNELTGFGIFSPISVAFDKDLDLDNIVARHRDDEKFGCCTIHR